MKRLERIYHILRSVPLPQLLRRVEILFWRKLEPHLLPKAPAANTIEWRHDLPKPIFPPRRDQWIGEGDRVFLNLAWGRLEMTLPMNWAPALQSRLDGSWRARLHYMEYLEGADDRWANALIGDWLNQVTLDDKDMRQFGWRSFNLAIRAVVWMQQVATRVHALSDETKSAMAHSLAHQLVYLERFLETDLRGNHLIKNVKALLWAGRCFNGELAGRWRKLGETHLARELQEQVLPDGMHYERSPAYHCQVLADLIECRQVLESGKLRDRLDEVIARMSNALAYLVHPDGQVAQFNDGGLSMAYPPQTCLDATGREAGWPDGPFSLPDAGYYGHRHGNEYLIADCAKLAPDYLIGHGHGDILSLEWSVGGHRVIVDQGTYQNLGGERRIVSRATASHNTISINGLNQGDFYGAHRCGRRPTPELICFKPEGPGFSLEGTHDGYGHLPGEPKPRRRITASPDRVSIIDWVDGSSMHNAKGGFLLHPGCQIEQEDTLLIISHAGARIELRANVPLDIVSAEWFPDLYCAIPTSRIIYNLPKEGGAKFDFECVWRSA